MNCPRCSLPRRMHGLEIARETRCLCVAVETQGRRPSRHAPQKAITACRGSSSILAERGLRPTSSLVASIILVSAAERASKKFRLHFLPPQEASSASPAFLRPLRALYYFPPPSDQSFLTHLRLLARELGTPLLLLNPDYLPFCAVTPRETRDCRFWLGDFGTSIWPTAK